MMDGMNRSYHVTIERDGETWRTVCPALLDQGAVSGSETREEALVHIEGVLVMILSEFAANGATPHPIRRYPAAFR
jgi:hypothetical protein